MPVPQGDTEKRAHTHSLCSHLPEFLVEEMQEAFTAPRREGEFEQGKGSCEKGQGHKPARACPDKGGKWKQEVARGLGE